MTRFRFVHAADLHLDTPFSGLGRAAPDVAEKLRDASLDSWDGLVRLTIDRQAAFLLLAGDIYDSPDRGVRAQLRFAAGLEQLAARGIRTFVVHGNHDALDGWSAIRTWPEGVTIFGGDRVESVAVERNGGRIATIHGISYPTRDVCENLSERFARGAEDGLHIGLLHCDVGERGENASYSPCTVENLREAKMDYWALGHVHQHQQLWPQQPLIVYPGGLQGRSPAPAEQGEKGAVVVEVEEDGRLHPELVPLDRIRFVSVDFDLSDIADLPALQRGLTAFAAEIRHANRDRGVLLRVRLIGRGPVHADLLHAGALDDLLRVLRQDAELEQPFLWWAYLEDQSGLDVDLDIVRTRSDFSAELLRMSDALAADPARLGHLLDRELEPLNRLGVHRWLGEMHRQTEAALLDGAARLAVEMLEQE